MAYNLAFDLGTNSVGVAAVAIEDDGTPTEILHAETVIHNGGAQTKEGASRKKVLGEKRRARNRRNNRKEYQKKLAAVLKEQGYPSSRQAIDSKVEAPYGDVDGLRAHMLENKLSDADIPNAISRVAHHIFNHRGFRNPWKSIAHLKRQARAGYSPEHEQFRERFRKFYPDIPIDDDISPSQLSAVLKHATGESRRVSTKATTKNSSGGTADAVKTRLLRSDYLREFYQICETQGIPLEVVEKIATALVDQEHPGGAADELAKKCPVNKKAKVARKVAPDFQEYRIAAALGNLRLDGKPLTVEQRQKAFELLNEWSEEAAPAWVDVAELFDGRLSGYDGGPRPVYNRNHFEILRQFDKKESQVIRNWWLNASLEDRSAFISIIDNAPAADTNQEAITRVQSVIDGLPDEAIDVLGNFKFKDDGRAEYSLQVLQDVTQCILTEGLDQHYAFKKLYGRDPSEHEGGANIGDLTGNPVVDTNLRIVQSLHDKIVAKHGTPDKIVVETSRGITASLETRQKRDGINKKNFQNRMEVREKFEKDKGFKVNSALEANRLMIFVRQNGECLYCGTGLTSPDYMQLDHIVPQAMGGRSVSANLAGTCSTCNKAKGKRTFIEWAGSKDSALFKKVYARLGNLLSPNGSKDREFKKFIQSQRERLRMTEEMERSTESLAWVSKELRMRLQKRHRKAGVPVLAPNGYATSAGRKLGRFDKFEGLLRFTEADHKGKPRGDRRHHALDALVMTTLTPEILEILATRDQLRQSARLNDNDTAEWNEDGEIVVAEWDKYRGKDAQQVRAFTRWLKNLEALWDLTDSALAEDEVVVSQRARRGLDTLGHLRDTVQGLKSREVTEAWSGANLTSIADPAEWAALTSHPDCVVAKNGTAKLPANPNRTVPGIPSGSVKVFPGSTRGILRAGGFVAPGPGFNHHIRVYDVNGKDCILPVAAQELKGLSQRNRGISLTSLHLPADGFSRRVSGKSFVPLPDKPIFSVQKGDIMSVSNEKLWEKDPDGKYTLTGVVFENARRVEEVTGVALPTSRFVVQAVSSDGRAGFRNLLVGETAERGLQAPDLLLSVGTIMGHLRQNNISWSGGSGSGL